MDIHQALSSRWKLIAHHTRVVNIQGYPETLYAYFIALENGEHIAPLSNLHPLLAQRIVDGHNALLGNPTPEPPAATQEAKQHEGYNDALAKALDQL